MGRLLGSRILLAMCVFVGVQLGCSGAPSPTPSPSEGPTPTGTSPGSSPTNPGGGTPTEPGATPTEPGHTPTEPGRTPTEPGHTPTEPGATPTEPGHTPTEPGKTPTEPGHTPTEPGHTPTEPGATPTKPGHTPTEPEATPPGPTPTRPAPTPTRPAHTPTLPGATPTFAIVTPTPGLPTPTAIPTPTPVPCTSIRVLQSANPALRPPYNTVVRVCGVVVTALDGTDGFFVQEPEGGTRSGIFVYLPTNGPQPAEPVAPGDSLDITGRYELFAGFHEISLRPNLTPPAEVSLLSRGEALPLPVSVANPATIATNCHTGAVGASAQSLEGVLVELTNQTVTDVDPCDQGRFGAFEVSNVLLVDDDLGLDYEPVLGDVLTRMTGVVHMSFDYYRLFPIPGGVSVFEPTPPPTPTPAPTPPPLDCTSPSALRDPLGGVPLGTTVRLCGVVVTGISGGDSFFVQTPDETLRAGMFIYRPNGFLVPADLALGDEVEVVGVFDLYDEVYEVRLDPLLTDPPAQVSIVDRGAPLPTPVVVSAADVFSDCSSGLHGSLVDAYDAVRVRLGPALVVDLDPCGQGIHGIYELSGSVLIDDYLGETFLPYQGQPIQSVVGVLHRFYGTWRVNPLPGGVVPR